MPSEVETSKVEASQVEASPEDLYFSCKVNLFDRKNIEIKLPWDEQLEEIKRSLLDPATACSVPEFVFAKEDGELLNSFSTAKELGLENGAVLTAAAVNYSDATALAHIARTREYLGFEFDVPNVPEALDYGVSAFAKILEDEAAAEETSKKSAKKNGHRVKKDDSQGAKSDSDADKKKAVVELASQFESETSINIPTPKFPEETKLATSPTPAVRGLFFSHWNPVPPQLRFKGYLYFLFLQTWDSKAYHIAVKKDGFSVISSNNEKFDISPRSFSGKVHESSALLPLIYELSQDVKKKVENNMKIIERRNIYSVIKVPTSFQSVPVFARPASPVSDMYRSQNTISSEAAQSRDWNDEFQNVRELEIREDSMFADTIRKDQSLNKLLFDSAEASVKGALALVRGDLSALNDNEPEDARIYIHNGIFFSHALDCIGVYEKLGGNKAARHAASKDLASVNYLIQLNQEKISPVMTTIVDYCGRRITAQGIVPGILSEQDTIIKYGFIDESNEIAHDEELAEAIQPLAKFLHLKPHKVGDEGIEMLTSVDVKGLVGTDSKKYLLDLLHLTPPDVSFLENNKDYPHSVCVLRHEAIEAWWATKIKALIADRKDKSNDELKAEIEKLSEKLQFNPDVLSENIPAELKETYESDKKDVRELSAFVGETLVDKFVSDLLASKVLLPGDGEQLTSLMHKSGINMRYLGLIYSKIQEKREARPFVADAFSCVVIHEAIARSIKHILNDQMKQSDLSEIPQLAAKYLSAVKDGNVDSVYEDISACYRFKVPADFKLNFVYIFNSVSQKLGLQWAFKDYSKNPITAEDLLTIVPVVKTTKYRSSVADNSINSAISQLQESGEEEDKTDNFKLLDECVGICEQVYGPVHEQVYKAIIEVSNVLYSLSKFEEAAAYYIKALVISERVAGSGGADIAVCYLNLATALYQCDQPERSLKFSCLAFEKWSFLPTAEHPNFMRIVSEIASTLLMLQEYKASHKWFTKSIELFSAVHGADSWQTAFQEVQMTNSIAIEGDYRKALEIMRRVCAVYEKEFGAEHTTTKDAKNWRDQLLQAAVTVEKNTRANIHMMATAKRVAPTKIAPKPKPELADKSIDELVKYINGDDASSKKKASKKKANRL